MRLTAFFAVAVFLPSAVAQTPLCDRLQAMTREPAVASAHWGVSVTALDGTPLCAVNDAQLFRPASNNKLFTTAAAFALLGPTGTVATQVFQAINGDLVLAGGGDANLDSGDLPYLPPAQRGAARTFAFPDLQDLAAQLVAKGVKSVTGDIVGDDSLFPWEPYPPSWNADDLVWGYGAPVSALSIADNQLRLTVTPGTAADGSHFSDATVTLDQHGIPYYTVESQVVTKPKGSPVGIGVERLPGERRLRIFGSVADGSSDAEEIAIDDPALYAAMAFRSVLTTQGIAITGTAKAKHRRLQDGIGFLAELHATAPEAVPAGTGDSPGCSTPAQPAVLASHTSAPLAEDAAFTMKTSQNLHAELMLRRLALQGGCGDGSNVSGARTIRSFLLQAGVDAGDFLLYDGSGLSDHDLVTPRAFTRLLTDASGRPWFAAWKPALPVGGVDGSLAARFAGPLKGRVFAKTGTLGESRALSGYVTTAGGKTLVFSILVDLHAPGSADRAVMDRMVAAVAAEQ